MNAKEKLMALSDEDKLRYIHKVDSAVEVLCMDMQLRVLVTHICDLDNEHEPHPWEMMTLEAIIETYGDKP